MTLMGVWIQGGPIPLATVSNAQSPAPIVTIAQELLFFSVFVLKFLLKFTCASDGGLK